MKIGKFLFLFAAALILTSLAHADGTPVNMVFIGVNGAHDSQFYVSPYYGTMNGKPVVLFCDDIINNVTWNQTWQANVTNLATALSSSNGFSNTRYGSSISPISLNAPTLYQEAAWLTTQFASHTSDFVSLQYAIWDLMNPNSEPTSYGDVQSWLDRAAANYSSIDAANFEIVTNVGPLAMTGQVQEFIVQTPEPGTLLLLLCGLGTLTLLVMRGQHATA